MEDIEKEINEQDTYENQDVETIQAMQSRFDAELAKEKQKYSALLKYATEGGKVSADTPQEPSPAEKRQHIEELAKAVRDNHMKSVDQAKALLEYDDYVVSNGNRTIFLPTKGAPTEQDMISADRVKSLLQYAVETSDGDNDVFAATLGSKLRDVL